VPTKSYLVKREDCTDLPCSCHCTLLLLLLLLPQSSRTPIIDKAKETANGNFGSQKKGCYFTQGRYIFWLAILGTYNYDVLFI
jgi:hypothetical protein